MDAANHDRETGDGVKVGGHQASSASLVTRDDRAVLRLAGRAGPGQREAARLACLPRGPVPAGQPGPLVPDHRCGRSAACSPTRAGPRTPTASDFSTGSVGLGAAAPLFAAAARRYVDAHFGARPRSRFIALIGDAELDEGNIWEAVADPATDGLGNVLWIVDVNRQSLDRVVPGVRIAQWEQQFSAAGWHVVEAKYGAGAAAGVRPAGRRRPARLDRRDAERALPVAVRPGPGRRPGALPGRRPGGREQVLRRPGRRRAGRPGHRPGRARPAARCWPRSRVRRGEGPAQRACSPTRSRAGGCRSPATRATTPRCSTTDQVDQMRGRLGLTAGDRVGPASTR